MSAPEQKFYYVKSKTVPVAVGQTTSPGVNIEAQALIGLGVPSNFDGTALEIQGSLDNASWRRIKLVDATAPLDMGVVAADDLLAIEAYLTIPWPYIRILCDTAQATTTTTFVFKLRQV